jgi:hypothetical protein
VANGSEALASRCRKVESQDQPRRAQVSVHHCVTTSLVVQEVAHLYSPFVQGWHSCKSEQNFRATRPFLAAIRSLRCAALNDFRSMDKKRCSELERSWICARVNSDHEPQDAEFKRPLDDRKIALEQDFWWG